MAAQSDGSLRRFSNAGADYSRDELEAMVDRYLEALVANDPSALPVTEDVVYIENNQLLKLGEGIWATITAIGAYKHYFADLQMGRAGFIGTVRENGVPAILDLRLDLRGDRVCAVEAYLIRDPIGCRRYEELGAPEDVWLQAVPPEQRVSRETLIAVANRYFDSMQRNDGKGDYSFFDKGCNRLEHGLQTTNVKKAQTYGHSEDTEFTSLTAEAQWKTGFLGFVTEIRDRRLEVVDEERQAVLAFAMFDHNGSIRSIDLTTGKVFVLSPYFDVPRTLQVIEGFRMRGDKLYRIEATMGEVPYGSRSPRRAPEPPRPRAGRSSPDAPAPTAHLEAVLAALKAHDPSKAPLAQDVRFTENGQVLEVGDGLWRTLTDYAGADGEAKAEPGSAPQPRYRIDLEDPASSEAIYFGAITETTTPGMMMLRTRAGSGGVSEVEVIAVRKEIVGERGGTVTMFQPRLLAQFDEAPFAETDQTLLDPVPAVERTSRQDMLAAVDRLFDAIETNRSEGAPIAPGCERRDNGVRTTNWPDAPPLNPDAPAYRPFALGLREQIDSGFFRRVSRVGERRHLMVDEARGLVLSTAIFDHLAQVKEIDPPGVGRVPLPGVRLTEEEAQLKDQLFGSRNEANLLVPTSDLVVQIARIVAGSIVRIETLSRGGPLGLRTGW